MRSRSAHLPSLALLVVLVSACVPPPTPASTDGGAAPTAVSSAATEAAPAGAVEAPDAVAHATPEAMPSEAPIPSFTIAAKDYSFDVPEDIPSGWVSLSFANQGAVNHHGITMHLKDGVTLDDVKASLADDNADPREISDAGFFLPDTDPGTSNQVALDLLPGNWVIASVSMADPSAGPTPDWARGSLAEFTVGTEPSGAVQPSADITVTIGPDDFDLPESVGAGMHTIAVVNNTGTPDAFAFILELRGDTTMKRINDTFDAMFSGQPMPDPPADFSAAGGLMDFSVGDAYTTDVDLKPGRYAVVTSIGGSDFPYSGMAKEFTVAP